MPQKPLIYYIAEEELAKIADVKKIADPSACLLEFNKVFKNGKGYSESPLDRYNIPKNIEFELMSSNKSVEKTQRSHNNNTFGLIVDREIGHGLAWIENRNMLLCK